MDGDARAAAELPTAHAAAVAFDSPEAGTLLVCAGLAGIVTSWNGFLVGASRLSYALTAAGLLPRWLIASDRDETAPRRILWTLCLLCCFAPWFGRPILVWLVDAGSVGVIVGYAIFFACYQAEIIRGGMQALRDASDGLRFIRRQPVIFGAISLDLFAVLLGGIVALLPAIADRKPRGLERVERGDQSVEICIRHSIQISICQIHNRQENIEHCVDTVR